MQSVKVICAIVFCLVMSNMYASAIYRSEDKEGHVSFSDIPQAGMQKPVTMVPMRVARAESTLEKQLWQDLVHQHEVISKHWQRKEVLHKKLLLQAERLQAVLNVAKAELIKAKKGGEACLENCSADAVLNSEKRVVTAQAEFAKILWQLNRLVYVS